MTIKERIQILCKNNHVSMNKVEETLGFGKGYLSKLGTTQPNSAKLEQLANYFNVSLDYIITGKDHIKSPEAIYERINLLISSRGISQGKLEKELGFSNGTISKWKTSTPRVDRLQKIADYFNISISYLIGENISNMNHSDNNHDIQKALEKIKFAISHKDSFPLYFNNELADPKSLDLISKQIDISLLFIEQQKLLNKKQK